MNNKKLKRYTKCRFSALGGGRDDPRAWEQAFKCDMTLYMTKN